MADVHGRSDHGVHRDAERLERGERDLSKLTKIASGGAPIAPATVEAWEQKFGAYIHNIYGLTETTSPSHCVPFGKRAPVDPDSGALSVGVPVFNTLVRVVDDDGNDVAPGRSASSSRPARRSSRATGTSPRRPSTRSPAASCTPATSG